MWPVQLQAAAQRGPGGLTLGTASLPSARVEGTAVTCSSLVLWDVVQGVGMPSH